MQELQYRNCSSGPRGGGGGGGACNGGKITSFARKWGGGGREGGRGGGVTASRALQYGTILLRHQDVTNCFWELHSILQGTYGLEHTSLEVVN